MQWIIERLVSYRHKYSLSPTTVLRWLAFVVFCFGIATVGWIVIEHQLTLWGRLVCPEGWWRSSPGVCAFPPVSISILAIGYAMVSLLLLATTVLLAPSHKLKTCSLLFVALALWPIYTLIFNHFSWVALASLCAVVGIAICFCLGAFAMTNPSFNGHTPPHTAIRRTPIGCNRR